MSDYYTDNEMEEMEYAESKEQIQKMIKHQNRYANEQAQAQAAQAQEKVFKDALKEHGLDEKTWQELLSKDPEGATKHFAEGVSEYVGKVARQRDPKTGRWLPGKAKQEPRTTLGRPAPKAQMKDFDPNAKRSGTDEEIQGMIDQVLPADDPLWKM